MTESRETPRTRVAVACQGGGSHTAFTAGVLDRLLAEADPAYEISALTGTSGGAICAFLAWYGLVSAPDEATGRERARELLDQVWGDIQATDPVTAAANRAGVWWARAREGGAPLPEVSPYDTGAATWTERYLRRALERAVPPDELERVVAAKGEEGKEDGETEGRTGTETGTRAGTGTEPESGGRSRPRPTLHLGAVDVTRGTFRTFTERDVTIDAVLASAAVPTVFRAVTVAEEEEERPYWDGLFSQNPPVRDLLSGRSREEKPEEIWVVRINPQRRDEVPESLTAIVDRRNELSGNLSLAQELAFVRRVNEWIADGSLGSDYRPVAVRTVGLDEDRLTPPRTLTTASKLDCRPGFVEELREAGRAAADGFLRTERNRRLVRGTVDAVWNTTSPAAGVYLADGFELHARGSPTGRGPATYDAFVERVRSALDGCSLRIDSTVADGDRVALTWTATGRHVGRLLGVDPTGERVSVRGVHVARVTDGDDGPAIAESWVAVDDAGFVWSVDGRDTLDDVDDVPVPATAATPVVTDLRAADESRRAGIAHAEQFWGRGPTSVGRWVVAPDHVFRRAGRDIEGRAAYEALVATYRAAFPDLQVSVRDAVAEGDRVVVRAAMTGTHEGPFEGLEPSGRRVEAHWTFVHELADGRIVSTGMVAEHGWLREQLAARPVTTVYPAETWGEGGE